MNELLNLTIIVAWVWLILVILWLSYINVPSGFDRKARKLKHPVKLD